MLFRSDVARKGSLVFLHQGLIRTLISLKGTRHQQSILFARLGRLIVCCALGHPMITNGWGDPSGEDKIATKNLCVEGFRACVWNQKTDTPAQSCTILYRAPGSPLQRAPRER